MGPPGRRIHPIGPPARRIHGIAALLLPFDTEGRPDLDGLVTLLEACAGAGLEPAVNMDTGFGPELTPAGRRQVLEVTSRTLEGRPFAAGAMPFGHESEDEAAYRAEVAAVVEAGGTPVVFPSHAIPEDAAGFIARVVAGIPRALAFELGTMFAPFGRIYDDETVRRLMAIPNLTGLKHSSLDRRLEWRRLALRDAERPDFRIYTGNDLAIDMVCYGSDYLLGLACFDMAAFAQRDAWWAAEDERFYALNDALQALGAVAFRDPVPAYKDSLATYLRLTGRLEDPRPHPACPRRPRWEAEVLEPLAERVTTARAPSEPREVDERGR